MNDGFGKPIIHVVETTSTMDEVEQRAKEGAPEGLVVWAGHQTNGRGRNGRQWSSTPSQGLEFSLLLRPKIAPARASPLALLAGVTVAEALAGQGVTGVTVKWPNDLRLNGSKLGGILLQTRLTGAALDWIILGVGLNVHQRTADLPAGATSLAQEGWTGFDRQNLLRSVLGHLQFEYLAFINSGGEFDAGRFNERAEFLGEQVEVTVNDNRQIGTFLEVATDGAAVIRIDDGSQLRVSYGDMSRGPLPV